MNLYTVYLNDTLLEKAFLSFIRSLNIRHTKRTDVSETLRIIQPQTEGNPAMLYGKWKDIEIDAKELRTKAWQKDII